MRQVAKEIQALGKRVLLEDRTPKTQESLTSGGIIVPTAVNAVKQAKQGVVVSSGDEVTSLLEGDEVLYAAYAGHEVVIDGVDYVLLNISDVLALLTDAT